jgi:hypothetical protein
VSAPVFHRRGDPGYVRLSDALVKAAGVLPDPTPQFRADLRARLVATAEQDGIGATAPQPSRRAPLFSRTRARGAILVGLAAGTLFVSGMSAASGNALPGDPLYPVKRSTESARLTLASSDVERGQLYLDFARTRLTEAQSLGGHRPGLSGTLDEMDSETRAGVKLLTQTAQERHDRIGLDVIDAFLARQRAGLDRLGDSVRLRQSLALLDEIAQRSRQVRAELAGGAGPGGAPNNRPGTDTGPGPHPQATGGGSTGNPSPGPSSPAPSTSPSGLLSTLNGVLGGGH